MMSNPREVLGSLSYHVDAGRVRAQSFPDLEAVTARCAIAIRPAVAHPYHARSHCDAIGDVGHSPAWVIVHRFPDRC